MNINYKNSYLIGHKDPNNPDIFCLGEFSHSQHGLYYIASDYLHDTHIYKNTKDTGTLLELFNTFYYYYEIINWIFYVRYDFDVSGEFKNIRDKALKDRYKYKFNDYLLFILCSDEIYDTIFYLYDVILFKNIQQTLYDLKSYNKYGLWFNYHNKIKITEEQFHNLICPKKDKIYIVELKSLLNNKSLSKNEFDSYNSKLIKNMSDIFKECKVISETDKLIYSLLNSKTINDGSKLKLTTHFLNIEDQYQYYLNKKRII